VRPRREDEAAMETPRPAKRAWRSLIARHLFAYLAVLAAGVVVVSAVFAREDLASALQRFDARWLPVVLGLTLLNYGLRFLKWGLLLRAIGKRFVSPGGR